MTDNERILIESIGRGAAAEDLLKFGRTNETPDAVRSFGNNAYDVLLPGGFDVDRLEFVDTFERGYFAQAAARSDPSLPWNMTSQAGSTLAGQRKQYPHTCPECGNSFEGTKRAVYDVVTCQQRAAKRRQRAGTHELEPLSRGPFWQKGDRVRVLVNPNEGRLGVVKRSYPAKPVEGQAVLYQVHHDGGGTDMLYGPRALEREDQKDI